MILCFLLPRHINASLYILQYWAGLSENGSFSQTLDQNELILKPLTHNHFPEGGIRTMNGQE